MKNIILLTLLIITQNCFSQENTNTNNKLNFTIRESNSSSISKVNNENKIERKAIHDEHINSKHENIKHERHIRPHFEKNTLKDHEKREHLKRENKSEIRHNRSERNNR